MLKSEKHKLQVTFYKCPSCVYFASAKGLFIQQSAEVCTEEGKGKEEATQTILRKYRKYKGERGHEPQFSEDLQALLFGPLCLAAL